MSEQEKNFDTSETHRSTQLPTYSQQFLSVITETALRTLEKYLKKRGISKDALRLLDSIVLLIHAKYIFKHQEGHMESVVEDVADILPSLSVDVVNLGGMFPAPEVEEMYKSVLEKQAEPA